MIDNFSEIKRIVIKIGSSLLVENGILRGKWLQALTQDIAQLLDKQIEVIIVSSGAIAMGRGLAGFEGKLTLQEKQAAAAVGQIELMGNYRDFFHKYKINVAQILLTAADCNDVQRYKNSQNTISTLLAKGIVPIINENDTVAVDEIKIGDNDRLAARVAQMISADLLILFSDIDGLYDKNPKTNPDAKFIAEVEKITRKIEDMAGGSSSLVGTGGMITKIIAAKMAVMSGCKTVITNGLVQNSLQKLLQEKQNYTIFHSRKNQEQVLKSRKKRLSGFLNAKGEVIINNCAREAMLSKKASLLAVGIVNVVGNFKAGDLVFIKDEEKNHIASGITNHAAFEARKIIGKNSNEIKKILGKSIKPEFIHIDNLIIL